MRTLVSVFGVEPRRIGGTEMFARELSAQLAEQGWRSVLCFLSEPEGDVRRFLELPNVSFETLANSTNGGWRAGLDLFRILRKHRAQMLHLHFVSFLTWYPWIGKLAGAGKVFFTDHHSRPAGYVSRRASFWKRVAARAIAFPITKVFCVSNYGYRCMTTIETLPRERFEMIYNGIDRSRINSDADAANRFRQRFSIPANRSLVGQVSWLIPEKGIDDFLEVARRVTTLRPDVQFVWVGDGAARERYEKHAEALGLNDRITFTGMIDDPLGEGVFQAFDVVCQFSRWEEVFGSMSAEAMANGKPVVATRVGGIPELVSDGESGYLVERGDAEAMSARVMGLLSSADTRLRMGEAAREIVARKFDMKANVAQLIESYGVVSEAQASARAAINNPNVGETGTDNERKSPQINPFLILEDES